MEHLWKIMAHLCNEPQSIAIVDLNEFHGLWENIMWESTGKWDNLSDVKG